MKKRLAVQFYGHLRTYEKTYESLFKHIVKINEKDGWEVDFFIYTYDKFEHDMKTWHNHNPTLKNRIVLKSDEENLQRIFRPKALKIAHLNKNEHGMLKSIDEGNKLRQAYEKTHHFRYDLIFYTRFDLLYVSDLRINTYLDIYQNHPEFKHFGLDYKFYLACHGQFKRLPVADPRYFLETLCFFANFNASYINGCNEGVKILIDYTFNRDYFMQREDFIVGFGSDIKQKYEALQKECQSLKNLGSKENLKALKAKNLELKIKKKQIALKELARPQFLLAQNESTCFAVKQHLSYKLGQAMIECSKSFFGYICLPYVLYYIKSTHKKENLETTQQFLDYEEAQSIKNHLSYKLGQGLLQRTRGGGGELCEIM
ncbi:hypothetical protein [Campylobacter vulpis]|uniref:hypothetical protein n=1 Tax=Campylobacter vulpis TaxID=1655500 RepID=UPI001BCF8E52|nr:hypothetical protein [Campylobacter vulpis]MBS4252771.1 hypothetical protein [Campylobacter vulpis]